MMRRPLVGFPRFGVNLNDVTRSWLQGSVVDVGGGTVPDVDVELDVEVDVAGEIDVDVGETEVDVEDGAEVEDEVDVDDEVDDEVEIDVDVEDVEEEEVVDVEDEVDVDVVDEVDVVDVVLDDVVVEVVVGEVVGEDVEVEVVVELEVVDDVEVEVVEVEVVDDVDVVEDVEVVDEVEVVEVVEDDDDVEELEEADELEDVEELEVVDEELVVVVDVATVVVVGSTTGPSCPLTLPTLMASEMKVPPRTGPMRFICAFCEGAQIWATTVVLPEGTRPLDNGAMNTHCRCAWAMPSAAATAPSEKVTRVVDEPEMFTPRPFTSTWRFAGVPSALTRALGWTLNRSTTSTVLGSATMTVLPLLMSTLQNTYWPPPASVSVPPLMVSAP